MIFISSCLWSCGKEGVDLPSVWWTSCRALRAECWDPSNLLSCWPQLPDSWSWRAEQQHNAFSHSLALQLTTCVCVCCGTPCSDHHIEEEREQVVHAPHEVVLQQRFDFQSQLLKGLMDDDEFVRWRERGAAHRWIYTLPLYTIFISFFFNPTKLYKISRK